MNPDLPPSSSETVSQSEVEGLLAQIGESASSSSAVEAIVTQEPSQPHAFRHLSSFSPGELRKLRVRHENFIRSLAARLSVHLRLEVGLKMTRLEPVIFEKLLEDFSNPTHLTLLRLEPLKGTCLLEIPPQLACSLVDRELGGPGECLEEDRALTEIECRIISRLIEMTWSEWCMTWSDLLDLRPLQMGHESNAALVQNFPVDTTMLVLGVEMQIGDLIKPIHFCFPYSTLEPLIQKLNVEADADIRPAEKAQPKLPKWNPALNDISVAVKAEFPGLKITVSELTKLKTGDVIMLDQDVFHHVRLSLAQTPKFVATVGKCGPFWAAKITKVLDSLPNASPSRVSQIQ
jgi:flagellar motor switch protein FliM